MFVRSRIARVTTTQLICILSLKDRALQAYQVVSDFKLLGEIVPLPLSCNLHSYHPYKSQKKKDRLVLLSKTVVPLHLSFSIFALLNLCSIIVLCCWSHNNSVFLALHHDTTLVFPRNNLHIPAIPAWKALSELDSFYSYLYAQVSFLFKRL